MDFVILKVNGQDVSRASHEDAVRAFQAAQEPIVVEVLRRASSSSCSSSSSSSARSDANSNRKEMDAPQEEADCVTASTQTDSWAWPASAEFPPPPPFDVDDDLNDDDDAGDQQLDFEEVTLLRSSATERLGLALFYPDGDEAGDETDVFVQNVEADGIAARDGRLQPGDQIVQINGEDVTSKEQAELLLSSRQDVVLLICRAAEREENECGLDPAETPALAGSPQPELQQQRLDNRVSERLSLKNAGEQTSQEKRDTMKSGSSSSSSSATGGSSATSSTADRRQGDERERGGLTMDREMQLVYQQMATIQRECESLARRQHAARRRPVEDHIYETIPECSESDEPLYCRPYESRRAAPPPTHCDVVASWLRNAVESGDGQAVWHRASSTSDSRSSGDSKPAPPPPPAGSAAGAPLALELTVVAGEARRKTTLTLPAPAPTPTPTRDTSLQACLESDAYSEVSCKHCRKCMRLPPLRPATPAKNKNVINSANAVEKNRNYVTFLPQGTHYTNAANLEETMQRQQRQLYQQLLRRGHSRVTPCGLPPSPPRQASPFAGPPQQYRYVSSPGGAARNHGLRLPTAGDAEEAPQFQYKVKVRSDGSRYIARRPLRKRMLKERAARIAEERTGVTTDDDAMSELKLGRYWPREEKKRQLEHAREKKMRLQQKIRMASLPEESTQDELSLKKREVVHTSADSGFQKRTYASSRRRPHNEEVPKHSKPPKTGDVVLAVTTV